MYTLIGASLPALGGVWARLVPNKCPVVRLARRINQNDQIHEFSYDSTLSFFNAGFDQLLSDQRGL